MRYELTVGSFVGDGFPVPAVEGRNLGPFREGLARRKP